MCLTDPFTGTNHLIISGGKDDKNKTINDFWSWNVQMSTWQKVRTISEDLQSGIHKVREGKKSIM